MTLLEKKSTYWPLEKLIYKSGLIIHDKPLYYT